MCVCVWSSDDDYMQNVHNREKVKQFVNVLQCAEQFSDKGKQVYSTSSMESRYRYLYTHSNNFIFSKSNKRRSKNLARMKWTTMDRIFLEKWTPRKRIFQ